MGTSPSPPSSCGTAYASWRCSISARTIITCSQNLCPCSTLILRHVPRINTVLPWQWMSWKSPKHACTHQTPQCGWSCKYDNTVSSTRYEKFTWISTQANLHEIMSPVIVRMEVCAFQVHRKYSLLPLLVKAIQHIPELMSFTLHSELAPRCALETYSCDTNDAHRCSVVC